MAPSSPTSQTFVVKGPRQVAQNNATPQAVAAERLVAQLAAEMGAAWRQGQYCLAEEFLERHPELYHDPEAALAVICEEICLRQELGQEVATCEFVHRFPQWQEPLLALFDCHRLMGLHSGAAVWPRVGEMLGDFQLLARLNGGAWGQVFVASQSSLADRPVVLKITPCEGQEHLSLARLQHTHIVPLYFVQHFPAKNLQAMCMPYLGGAALSQLLTIVAAVPAARRTGQHLLDALDQVQAGAPIPLPAHGPARAYLARATFVQAMGWIGVALSDALQYAHERGLVHLDLKPGNVLLTADGQPMLLDFHLAREPLQPGRPAPARFGGTPGYMSPEQQVALAAVSEQRPIPTVVDQRSDVYSLGMLLYEALGGTLPGAGQAALPPLNQCNPEVSVGLADIVHKCLAPKAPERYADAASLGTDLRKHLNHLPLRGVRNRSVLERWRKWRCRRPRGLAFLGKIGLVVGAAVVAGAIALNHLNDRLGGAKTALADGCELLAKHHYVEAERSFSRGLALVDGLPGNDDVKQALTRELGLAKGAKAAGQLHVLADRLRFLYDPERLAPELIHELDACCSRVWEQRHQLMQPLQAEWAAGVGQNVRADLLEVAILWCHLRNKLPATQGRGRRRNGLGLLSEAEELLGPSVVLDCERRTQAALLRLPQVERAARRPGSALLPRTAWEHYAVGRCLLHSGNLIRAAAEFEQALALQPQEFWPHFYQGICAYRLGHYGDAATAFEVCVTLAPRCAECYANRAQARAALGQPKRALQDYDRALEVKPDLAGAALNRGILHYQHRRYHAASADLERALRHGADPALVHYNLALIHLARKDCTAAKLSLRRALKSRPGHEAARTLYDCLPGEP